MIVNAADSPKEGIVFPGRGGKSQDLMYNRRMVVWNRDNIINIHNIAVSNVKATGTHEEVDE